jgi:putative DNA primase/helicase
VTPLEQVRIRLEAHGCDPRGSGDKLEAKCPCPAHGDRRASLSVGVGQDGRVLLRCFAGCQTEDVIDAIGLGWADLYEHTNGNGPREIVATYDYTDEHGALLFQVVRFAPKDFRQRRPDGRGDWVWKLGNTRRVLYRLPAVIAAVGRGAPIWVVEGERDVAALERAGAVATTNPGGAGKWRDDYSETLAGATVTVVADRDDAGLRHAGEVSKSLLSHGCQVRIVRAGEGMGKDAATHLANGGTLEDFVELETENGMTEADSAMVEGLQAVPFSAIKREPISWLWEQRIPLGMVTLIIGDPGLGKSLFTNMLAAQTSSEASVLLATAEDSLGATVRPRLEAAGADLSKVCALRLRREGIEEGLALPDDVAELDARVTENGAQLVVVDPLMAHLPESVNSWRDQSVRRALAPLARMAAERSCAVVVVAHLNKARGGDPLYRAGGSVGIPAAARSALLLARDPEDPESERGVRRILAHIKCNVGPQAESITCAVEPTILPGDEQIQTARLKITGTSAVSGAELLSSLQGEEKTERDEAREFLGDELTPGPRPVKELRAAANEAGLSWRTVERAKAPMGIKAERESAGSDGSGRWLWRLPQDRQAQDRHVHISEGGGLGGLAVSMRDSGVSDGGQNPQDRHVADMAALRADTANGDSGVDLDYLESLMRAEERDRG